MRIFLVGLSLLYVIGVSFAQNLEIEAGPVPSECDADLVAVAEMDHDDIDGLKPRRITYGIMPDPALRLRELGETGDMVPKGQGPAQEERC